MEKKQKLKLSDIWYYYKVHFIVILIVIALIAYTVYNKVTQINDDFLIECMSDIGFSYDTAGILADSLEQSGVVVDIDGDGIVQVNILTYQTGFSGNQNIDLQMAQVVALRMAMGEGPIIIADKQVFEEYEQHGIFKDISAIANELGIDESRFLRSSDGTVIGISIWDSQWIENNGINCDGLYASLRIINPDLSNNKNLLKQYDAAEDIFKYIVK